MMKSIMSCLIISLLLMLPGKSFGQSVSQPEKGQKPGNYANWHHPTRFLGTRLKVTLMSGQVIEGRLIGWQNSYTEVSLQGKAPSILTKAQPGTAYLKLEGKDGSRVIPFSEIRSVAIKRNFIQNLGQGFGKVGRGLRYAFSIALLSIFLGIDWLIHGGNVEWDL